MNKICRPVKSEPAMAAVSAATATRLDVSPLTTRPKASANLASKVLSLSDGSGLNGSNVTSGRSTSKIQAVASSGRSDAPATEARRARLHAANWIVDGHPPSLSSVLLTLYGATHASHHDARHSA